MKSKRWAAILVSLFVCLGAGSVAAIGAGYLYLQDQPPNPLSDSGYYVGRTKVYYHPGFGLASPFEIPGADVRSFKILHRPYALDAGRVYLEGYPIPSADPASFEVLGRRFARDAAHVYLGSEIFSDDPANFELVSETIARDSLHIYWANEAISDDPANLTIIGRFDSYTYLRDSQSVYVNGNAIQGADAASFQVILAAYGRDDAQVFYFDQPIPEADLSTFEVIESPFSRDARAVYWMGTVIPEADPTTFRVLNADWDCSADSVHAYHRDTIIPGVDASAIPPGARVSNCSATGLALAP